MTDTSPLSRADAYRQAGDIPNMVFVLLEADEALNAQRFYPLVRGDVVTVDVEPGRRVTYEAVDDRQHNVDGTTLRLIDSDGMTNLTQWPGITDFYTLWFRVGPRALCVLRGEQLLFDRSPYKSRR